MDLQLQLYTGSVILWFYHNNCIATMVCPCTHKFRSELQCVSKYGAEPHKNPDCAKKVGLAFVIKFEVVDAGSVRLDPRVLRSLISSSEWVRLASVTGSNTEGRSGAGHGTCSLCFSSLSPCMAAKLRHGRSAEAAGRAGGAGRRWVRRFNRKDCWNGSLEGDVRVSPPPSPSSCVT